MPRHDEGFFTTKDNLRLFWESELPDAPKAHLAVVHGYWDHAGRYTELAKYLAEQGIAVHVYDQRGHGQSGGRRGHVERFDQYIDDLAIFWDQVGQAAGGKKTFLLGHSFGGLVSTLFLARKPPRVAGAILSSPLYEYVVKPPPHLVLVAKILVHVLPRLPFKNPLKAEELTRDPERQKIALKDPLYGRLTTPGWFRELNNVLPVARALAPQISVPLLMFSGTKDPVVSHEAVKRFCEQAASTDKTWKPYVDYVHECMNDVGREQVWADISNWISQHL